MGEILLNETPIRTSKSFEINNIKIENFKIKNRFKAFKNIETNNEIAINKKLNNSQNDSNLTYGLSKDLEKQVNENSNVNINLKLDKRKSENTINYLFDKDNLELVDNLNIEVEENTNHQITIEYYMDSKIKENKDLNCYHNGITRINVKKDATLNIVIVNLLNTASKNFMAIEANLEENAKINFTIIDFGGEFSISNLYTNLVGDNSKAYINTIYLGKENQNIDINYIVHLRGKKSVAKIDVQGALKDKSKKHFKGTIDFKKGCKGSKGSENEECMLLSKDAKSIGYPVLLSSENDVEGSHSNSASRIGNKSLFYIMSRGFSKKETMVLMVKAKFNKILENIKDEELKEKILKEIDNKIK